MERRVGFVGRERTETTSWKTAERSNILRLDADFSKILSRYTRGNYVFSVPFLDENGRLNDQFAFLSSRQVEELEAAEKDVYIGVLQEVTQLLSQKIDSSEKATQIALRDVIIESEKRERELEEEVQELLQEVESYEERIPTVCVSFF